jgi:hypothetical protein
VSADKPERKKANPAIDKAINELMTRLNPKQSKNPLMDPPTETVPIDMAVKVIQAAIQWEKVKHAIEDDADQFNPSDL